MVAGWDRRFANQNPHYEVWYGKLDVNPDSAFWFRYSIMNGHAQHIASWGILFDQGKIHTGKNIFSLGELEESSTVFRVGENCLTETSARGQAGELSWDLNWQDKGRHYFFEPLLVQRLKLARSHYHSCLMDLRVSGTINHAGRSFALNNVTGMMGHIYGQQQAESWAWLHCNQFNNHPDVVCEGLSARIKIAKFPCPALTQFVLYVGERKYVFGSARGALMACSIFGQGRWEFRLQSGGVTLAGEAIAPAQGALVEYSDTDDAKLWCSNSKLASLIVRLTDPTNNLDETFVTANTCAFELVDRLPPKRAPDL